LNVPNAQTLERTLASAVVVSWTDLMKDSTSGLLHIEYTFAPDNSLDYLKIWSSVASGEWHLACAYWTASSTFHDQGIHFEDGFQSDALGRNLEFVVQHQPDFSSSLDRGRTGLLKIQMPTEVESTAAAEVLRQAFGRFQPAGTEPTSEGPALAIA
jgi:hypothetical protein